ncbi:MAG TPA: hypothetical protein VFY29_02560 [Terriglobia bacterium]|nr:hypothetical protein [Terriglobia bacterium]
MDVKIIQAVTTLVFLAVTSCAPASGHKVVAAVPGSAQGKTSIQFSVREFLNSWLVDRNVELALQSFGAAAIQNEMMLSDSCAGYIAPSERASEQSRRDGIARFLRDFLPEPPVTDLRRALNAATAARLASQKASRVINDPTTDSYVLMRVGKDEISGETSEATRYLRARLPASVNVLIVPIGAGMVNFVWTPEGSGWKVAHASLVCM